MSLLPVGIGSSGGYTIDRSVRLRSSASAYLSRTPASAGNRKTWTWSGWFKRGALNNGFALFGCGVNNTEDTICYFGPAATGDQIDIIIRDGSTIRGRLTTSSVYRDPSSWYHTIVVWDSSNATSSDRLRLYMNGSRVASFSTEIQPPQNTNSLWNASQTSYIGKLRDDTGYHFDGYLTEINFIDGQALDPTSFGEYDALTGVWKAKKYAGTYGTNGFYLNFSDNTSTTTLGYDTSGNSNNWTANNISLTAGTTYDSMTDVPTLTSETAANYAVFNPVQQSATGMSYANLRHTTTGTSSATGTISVTSGKWYWEVTVTTLTGTMSVGAITETYQAADNSWGTGDVVTYRSNGDKYGGGSAAVAYGATYTTNDVIGVALDMDSGTIVFYKNNSSQGTAFSTWISGKTLRAFVGGNTTGGVLDINFGQRPFAYTPPTGFKALNTFNLPDSTIVAGNKYFDATLYTGTGSNLTVTNSGSFQPDFVWIKSRSAATNNRNYDSVRGNYYLVSNSTAAEVASGTMAIQSNGFLVGTDSDINTNTATYVGWQWKAGGTAVSNTDGTITSQVSANTTSGFSIVTYTGTGAVDTVGHGLGAAPAFIIVKRRSGIADWAVYSSVLGNTKKLQLDTTVASTTSGNWNNTSPTSSVFAINGASSEVGSSGSTYVAYCFAEVPGFSKFGSYTGNGSADGPFVFCGFRPAFVMVKMTSSTSNWYMWDSVRGSYNANYNELYANLSNSEGTIEPIDILSNGFKLRTSSAVRNASGGTYVYACFAENPFKNSLAR